MPASRDDATPISNRCYQRGKPALDRSKLKSARYRRRMSTGIAGFWSYVHSDDAADGGRVTSLSDHLRAQYQLLTAESLALFVDRRSLDWGDEWANRIDAAIAGTTFF